jgi:hypothetical protein
MRRSAHQSQGQCTRAFLCFCVPLVMVILFSLSFQPTALLYPSPHGTSESIPTATPHFATLLPSCSRTAPKFRFVSRGIFFCYSPVKIADSALAALQDELASMMVDGRLKVIVESEFPFTQQGVTDMCPAPARSTAAMCCCLLIPLAVSRRFFLARASARTFSTSRRLVIQLEVLHYSTHLRFHSKFAPSRL